MITRLWQTALAGVALGVLATACLERSPVCTTFGCDDHLGSGEPVVLQPTYRLAKYESETVVTWTHDVLDTGVRRLLLVVCNSDIDSVHPVSVTVNGTGVVPSANQDAPSYGALSVWAFVGPPPGANRIEVTYAQVMSGLARSLSFENVDAGDPVAHVSGGTHQGGGTLSVAGRSRDYPLALVSWSNDQTTTWLNGELELWDDTDPGPSSSLGGAAATLPGAAVVEFAWETASGSSTSGANLGLSIRAAR